MKRIFAAAGGALLLTSLATPALAHAATPVAGSPGCIAVGERAFPGGHHMVQVMNRCSKPVTLEVVWANPRGYSCVVVGAASTSWVRPETAGQRYSGWHTGCFYDRQGS